MSTPQNRRAELTQKIAETVTTFMDSAEFVRWLQFQRQFHDYSWGNRMLIWAQCPHATHVAGYKKWQKLGRQVRQGESGNLIIRPFVKEDEETGERKVTGFGTTYVWDISQTDGPDDYPELPHERMAQLADDTITDVLVHYCQVNGVLLDTDDAHCEERGALGVFRPADNRIIIKSTLDEAIWQHTLVHELMHFEIFRNKTFAEKLPRHLHEVAAETGALLVMASLGYEIDPASVAYISRYAEEVETFSTMLEVAVKFSDPIVAALEAEAVPQEALTA